MDHITVEKEHLVNLGIDETEVVLFYPNEDTCDISLFEVVQYNVDQLGYKKSIGMEIEVYRCVKGTREPLYPGDRNLETLEPTTHVGNIEITETLLVALGIENYD